MAKNTSRTDELVEMLRARGLRKQVAKQIADATNGTRKRTPTQVLRLLDDLRKLADELEDRVTGGPAKRKAAAQKAAATRKRAATKRSTAAKKAATTRARKSGTSTTKRAATSAKRTTTSAKRTGTATAKKASTTAKRATTRARAKVS
jgi:hypothetical protein